jgi:hypothetical protein
MNALSDHVGQLLALFCRGFSENVSGDSGGFSWVSDANPHARKGVALNSN